MVFISLYCNANQEKQHSICSNSVWSIDVTHQPQTQHESCQVVHNFPTPSFAKIHSKVTERRNAWKPRMANLSKFQQYSKDNILQNDVEGWNDNWNNLDLTFIILCYSFSLLNNWSEQLHRQKHSIPNHPWESDNHISVTQLSPAAQFGAWNPPVGVRT